MKPEIETQNTFPTDGLEVIAANIEYMLYTQTYTEILQVLAAHTAADEKERTDIATIHELMALHPNLLSADCKEGHFTGSALIVDVVNKRFLLHLHKKLGKWFQMGGHPDDELDMAAVALREAQEESGITDLQLKVVGKKMNSVSPPLDIDIHYIPEKNGQPRHPHLDFRYIIETANPDTLATELDGESTNFKWYSLENIDEVAQLVDPQLFRLITKAAKIYI